MAHKHCTSQKTMYNESWISDDCTLFACLIIIIIIINKFFILPHSLFSLSFFKCEIELEFKGTKRVITGDCPSLEDCGITEVRSCKVIRGVWELCEGCDYTKPYVQLNRGQCHTWGTDNSTAPVLSIKHVTTFNIRLYEKENFKVPVCETTVECPSVEKRFGIKEVRSCKVISGVWKLWKGCDYSGEYYLLKEGEYHNLEASSDGESTASAPAPAPISAPAQSLECVPFKILLYEKVDFEGPMYETTADCPSLNDCGLTEVRSCKVISGVWKLFKGRYFTEPSYQLQEREYCNLEVWRDANTALSVKRVTG